MGRFYAYTVTAASVSAASDLAEFTAATDRPFRIWNVRIWQTTDLGDANEEVLEATIQRGVTAGSGGASVTLVSLDRETSADTTAAGIRTTAHTGGTVVYRWGWNIRIPDDLWFTPETAPTFDAATDPVTISLPAPADAITVGCSVLIEEL